MCGVLATYRQFLCGLPRSGPYPPIQKSPLQRSLGNICWPVPVKPVANLEITVNGVGLPKLGLNQVGHACEHDRDGVKLTELHHE